MTRNDIIRMAEEAGFGANQRATLRLKLQRFAALVAAAERERIASQWDALHDKYMADPLRRQMMLSYESMSQMIRGQA
jgi:hypothetical protein